MSSKLKKAHLDSIYVVTVVGQYYSSFVDAEGHRQKKIRKYKIKVKLPSMDAALSVIRNHLLENALKKKHSDYTKFRTHIIDNVEAQGGGVVRDRRYMNLKQLQNYIEELDLPINISVYTDIQELREAIRMVQEEKERFGEWNARNEEANATTNTLKALNPDLFNETENEDIEDVEEISEEVSDAKGNKSGRKFKGKNPPKTPDDKDPGIG